MPDSPLVIESVEGATYRTLRAAILHLEFKPGQRLYAKELAERYGISEMPVRQALRRLEAERLVTTTRPRRGTTVAALSEEEIEEIQAIRLGVEGLLARHGAIAMADDVLADLEPGIKRIDHAYRTRDLDAYLATQAEFRDICYRAAQRPRLLVIAAEQRSRVERYLRVLFSDVEALEASRQHQVDLLDACRNHDGLAAEAATRRAILWTLDRVIAHLRADARMSVQASATEQSTGNVIG